MKEMSIGVLRKDIGFIEDGITLTNMVKKNGVEAKQEESVATKCVKKMRVFLKKHRQI